MRLPSFEYRKWYEVELNCIESVRKRLIEQNNENKYCYRGMADYNFICISTFYRHYLSKYPNLEWVKTDVGFESNVFLPQINKNLYKAEAIDILDVFNEKLDELGSKKLSLNSVAYLAQHYGLPTNLIDFTADPKVALYFACSSHFETDCVVYMYDIYSYINKFSSLFFTGNIPYRMSHPDGTLMSNKEAGIYVQNALTTIKRDGLNTITPIVCHDDIKYGQRIINQKGLFVYHCDTFPFDQVMYTTSSETYYPGRKVYKIPSSLKEEILHELNKKHGINHKFLFPSASDDKNLDIIEYAVKATKNMLAGTHA